MLILLILFLIAPFFPLCANKKNKSKNILPLNNSTNNLPVLTNRTRSDKAQSNLQNNKKNKGKDILKASSKLQRRGHKDESFKKSILKTNDKNSNDTRFSNQSKVSKEINMFGTAKQIDKNEILKKDKTNQLEKKGIGEKGQIIENVKKVEEAPSRQPKEESKKNAKEGTSYQTQNEDCVRKSNDTEIEKEYQENVNKVKMPFDAEAAIKDKENIMAVGQLKVHKGLEVWACDSLSSKTTI
uniref:Uncharacterized protein n=2 Tax=Strongyloides stercoralis TaxID=6248 RepID=A0A0K0ET83_STRER